MKPWAQRQIDSANSGKKVRSVRRSQPTGDMNSTETAYAYYLAIRKANGEILEYDYEPENFRLAAKTFYRPDFRVVMADLTIEFHEVKACRADGTFNCEDDAVVKFKIAAETHWMYTWRMCGRLPKNGGWKIVTANEVKDE